MAEAEHDHANWRPRHNPWLIAMTVTLATFMEVLDTSIANVAVPHIAGSLAATPDEATWVLTSYLVSNAIVLPMSAWLSKLFGRKRFYMTCVALFTISSFLCGIAGSLGMLIIFRVFQGAGGGGLQPSEQAILADTFKPRQRGMAFAVYGMAVVVAPALGPTLGGWITDNISWRWIFFLNIPVGIVSLVATYFLVEDPPWEKGEGIRKPKVDYIGIGFICLGLGALQVVLDKGQEDDWLASHFILTLAIISGVCIVSLILWECFRAHDPIIDLKLLRERNFAAANLLMFILGVVLFGSTVLLPLFVQALLGYTAEEAGMVISPGGIAVMLLMPLVGFLLSHVQARYLIAVGLCITGYGLLRMANFNSEIDFSTAAWARVFQAAGLAFLFVPINTISYAFLPREKYNQASGLVNLSRNLGGSVGISVATTLVARHTQMHQNFLVANISTYNATYRAMFQQLVTQFASAGYSTVDATRKALAEIAQLVLQQATTLAYTDVFHLLAIASFSSVIAVFLLKRNDPRHTESAH